MFLSIVTNTSNLPSANVSSSPFFLPANPTSGTVKQSCPWTAKAGFNKRETHSSNSSFSLKARKNNCLRLFKPGNRFLTGHGRKFVQKLVQRFPVFQIVEQSLKRDARATKNRLAAKDVRVFDDDRHRRKSSGNMQAHCRSFSPPTHKSFRLGANHNFTINSREAGNLCRNSHTHVRRDA